MNRSIKPRAWRHCEANKRIASARKARHALGVLAALFILAAAWGCARSGESNEGRSDGAKLVLMAKKVQVAQVVRRDFRPTFQATGTLEAQRSARLSALVGGPVQEVLVDIGDEVKAAQVLLRLRPLDYALAVRAARAGLDTARASLAELKSWRRPEEIEVLKAQLQSARTNHEQVQRQRKRLEALFKKRAVSESDWDEVRTAAEAAHTN